MKIKKLFEEISDKKFRIKFVLPGNKVGGLKFNTKEEMDDYEKKLKEKNIHAIKITKYEFGGFTYTRFGKSPIWKQIE
jgi:hypothetical protein